MKYDKTEKPNIKSGKLYPPDLSFHIEVLDIKQQDTQCRPTKWILGR